MISWPFHELKLLHVISPLRVVSSNLPNSGMLFVKKTPSCIRFLVFFLFGLLDSADERLKIRFRSAIKSETPEFLRNQHLNNRKIGWGQLTFVIENVMTTQSCPNFKQPALKFDLSSESQPKYFKSNLTNFAIC